MSETTSVSQSLSSGWNLLGLPLATLDRSYSTLFPNAVPASLTGYEDGNYTNSDSLKLGQGYFLQFEEAGLVQLTGFPAEDLAIPLVPGWNLVSSGSAIVPISSIIDPGRIIIPGTIYGFDGAYYPAETMQPGNGYWIRAGAAGLITLPGQQIPRTGLYPGPSCNPETGYGSIHVITH